jgi:hypothetical protein
LQITTEEQPSETYPQDGRFVQATDFAGVHAPGPHSFAPPPPPQVCPFGQLVPHTVTPPQPFGMLPQSLPLQYISVGQPHMWLCPPPPQLIPVGQFMPQSIVEPQLSETTPHCKGAHTDFIQFAKSCADSMSAGSPERSALAFAPMSPPATESGVFQQ